MPPSFSDELLPRLNSLGRDLLVTTRCQLWIACARPFLGLVAYGVVAWFGWWWLMPPLAFLIFSAKN